MAVDRSLAIDRGLVLQRSTTAIDKGYSSELSRALRHYSLQPLSAELATVVREGMPPGHFSFRCLSEYAPHADHRRTQTHGGKTVDGVFPTASGVGSEIYMVMSPG